MNSKTQYCLLLEDDPDDQEIFLEAIHDVSSRTACYAVSNGIEGLEVLEKGDVTPDFIFSDLNMPHLDGFEFLKRVRTMERFRRTPFIFYTGDFSEQTIEKARKLGATAIFSKTRMGMLKDILKKYLV